MSRVEYKAALKNLPREIRTVILYLEKEIESLHSLDHQSVVAAFKDEALKMVRTDNDRIVSTLNSLTSKLAADRDLIDKNLKQIADTRDKMRRDYK